MKITKIEVCDFRGFPGPAVYNFEFGNAPNLLIYGENGSGKSSLFRAVREFFNRGANSKAFAEFKNIDDPGLTSGHITIHFDTGAPQSWPHGGSRPMADIPVSQTALQVGCLDYRSLLETNFSQKGNTVNLFEIAINHLVHHMERNLTGGGSLRIGELWSAVIRRKPRSPHKRHLVECQQALDRFNSAFEPVIAPLIERASELLSRFPGCEYSLGLAFQPVEYDKPYRQYKNRELILSVHRNGELLTNHHNFLNEARLSAIGLVIYLAALLISVPPTSAFPKVLVLDDVLIGLDMANRMPVIALLSEYFPDWQVILLTHDKVWYEWARLSSGDPSRWTAYELRLDANQVPVHRLAGNGGGVSFFLGRAREHIANGDLRAAGNYARAAFDWKVKRQCEKAHVAVEYSSDPNKVTTDKLWNAAKNKALAVASPTQRLDLGVVFARIEACRTIILNPLSHEAAISVERVEVEGAIAAIENLRFA